MRILELATPAKGPSAALVGVGYEASTLAYVSAHAASLHEPYEDQRPGDGLAAASMRLLAASLGAGVAAPLGLLPAVGGALVGAGSAEAYLTYSREPRLSSRNPVANGCDEAHPGERSAQRARDSKAPLVCSSPRGTTAVRPCRLTGAKRFALTAAGSDQPGSNSTALCSSCVAPPPRTTMPRWTESDVPVTYR